MTMNTQLLALVLDELIPPRPDGRLPGAGTLGVGAVVEHAAAGTPDLLQMLSQGLAALDDVARRSGAEGFAALSPTDRIVALRDIEQAEPLFLSTLLTLACVGYYSAEPVVAVLKGSARPPHPLGYELESDDLSLLDPVRARGKLYREC
jgi:Gluconate 2-dehydrogenase subunit 3